MSARLRQLRRVGIPLLAISGSALNGLANSALAVGDPIDPASIDGNYNTFEAYWELRFTPAASISAGVLMSLYFVPTLDGTKYADGGASLTPALVHLADQFVCAAGTGEQCLTLPTLLLPPFKFKPMLLNGSGQAIVANNSGQLTYATFTEQYVTT